MSGTIKSYKISTLTGSNAKGRVITQFKNKAVNPCTGCHFLTSPLACPTETQETVAGLPSCSKGEHIYLKVEKA